jgi:hypothetical protein
LGRSFVGRRLGWQALRNGKTCEQGDQYELHGAFSRSIWRSEPLSLRAWTRELYIRRA